jgi:hypothetical protein
MLGHGPGRLYHVGHFVDGKEEEMIEVGQTVYHPRTGEPLVVVNIDDIALLEVQVRSGTHCRIGRKAVLLEPPKKET